MTPGESRLTRTSKRLSNQNLTIALMLVGAIVLGALAAILLVR